MALKRKLSPAPPSFKLLKLPFVALTQVLSRLGFQELYNLSTCSEKAKTVINFVGKSPPLKIEINIRNDEKEIHVFSFKGSTVPICVWSFEESRNTKTRGRKVRRIGGIEMDIREGHKMFEIPIFGTVPVRHMRTLTPLSRMDVAMNAVLSQLLGTFRHSEVYTVSVVLKGISEKFQARRALAAVTKVYGLKLEADKYTSRQDIQCLLSNIEVSECLDYGCPVSLGSSIVDKLNCSAGVVCANSTWMRPETFWNMNCHFIELRATIFRSEDIQEFLRRWKDSERKGKIHFVEIHHPFGMNLDYEALDAKPWDPEVRPKMSPGVELYDCSSGMDIRRADGRIGIILHTTDTSLVFLVWPRNTKN